MNKKFNYEDAKDSNSLINQEKSVTATTDEKIFFAESFFITKKMPVNDTSDSVMEDIRKGKGNYVAIEIYLDVNKPWNDKRRVLDYLWNDKCFTTRMIYQNDEDNIVWVVQKTNGFDKITWLRTMAEYLRKWYNLEAYALVALPDYLDCSIHSDQGITFRKIDEMEWAEDITSTDMRN